MKRLLLCAIVAITSAAASAADAWKPVLSLSGKGTQTSPRITLGENWRARWDAKLSDSSFDTCQITISADSKDRGAGQTIANEMGPGGETVHGESAGTFQFSVSGFNCRWTLVVEERIPQGEQASTPEEPDPFATSPQLTHIFTHVDGRTVQGRFISASHDHVRFTRVRDGAVFVFPIAELIESDRVWIESQREDVFAR